jgi:hypothetical protein
MLFIKNPTGGGVGGAYLVPAGGEVLFYGQSADVPENFVIDTALYDNFILGDYHGNASDTPEGSHTHTHTNSNTGSAGSHTHTARSGYMTAASGAINHYSGGATKDLAPNGHTHSAEYNFVSSSAGSHSHTIGNTGSADVRPPYTAMYLIEATIDEYIPVNGIIFWDGPLADIPAGFSLCNGLNGTPDLRDKFIYGAQDDAGVGTQGGALTHTHSMPNTGLAGSHTHSITVSVGYSGADYNAATGYGGTSAMATPHGHSGSGNLNTQANHSHTIGDTGSASNLPPYIKLYFIMKVE